jgi:hypothetical protein
MNIVFTLSMPGCSSWNGTWSAEGKLYAVVKSFSTAKAKAKAAEILAKGYYSYGWSDGWRAGIAVARCDGAEARRIRAKSAGFCGYEWMIQSIIDRGCILADHEVPAAG